MWWKQLGYFWTLKKGDFQNIPRYLYITVMRLALKSLGMTKNVIIAHAMRDVELSMSVNTNLPIGSCFLSFFKFLDGFSR